MLPVMVEGVGMTNLKAFTNEAYLLLEPEEKKLCIQLSDAKWVMSNAQMPIEWMDFKRNKSKVAEFLNTGHYLTEAVVDFWKICSKVHELIYTVIGEKIVYNSDVEAFKNNWQHADFGFLGKVLKVRIY
jgi:hypothetical protein